MTFGPSGKMILLLAGFVVVVAGLQFGEPLLVPLCLALVITTVSAPIIRWLESKRVPRGLAITIAMLINLAVLAGLGTLVGSSLNEFYGAAPRYQAALTHVIRANVAWLETKGIHVSPNFFGPLQDFSRLVDVVGSLLKGIANLVSTLFFVLLLVAFTLVEFGRWRLKLSYAMGGRPVVLSRLTVAARELQKYLGVKTAANAVTGLLCGAWAAIVGVDFPILWGLIAFLLNYIPTIGAIIAAVPPILLAWLAFGPGTAFVTAVGYVLINVLMGRVVEPRIMGRALGLSPLVVLISLIFWWWIWGPVGALLSAPLTMAMKIVLASTPDLRWLAIMLGSARWVEEMQAQWNKTKPVDSFKTGAYCVGTDQRTGTPASRTTDPPPAKPLLTPLNPAAKDST